MRLSLRCKADSELLFAPISSANCSTSGPSTDSNCRSQRFFVHRIDEIGRFGGRGIELQLVLQRDHILHRDLIVGDVHFVIGLNPALPGRFRIERKQGDLIAEQLLEALDKTASPLPAALFHRAKPVLVVHVKNEIDGLLVLDQAAQYQAREKGFARAGLAKNAIAALDKPVEIDAHRRVHVQRRAQG